MRKSLMIAGSLLFANQIGMAAEQVPGELIVKLKSGSSVLSFDNLIDSSSMKLDREFSVNIGKFVVVKVDELKANLISAQSLLESMPEVEYVEPNFIYKIVRPIEESDSVLDEILSYKSTDNNLMYTPNDPEFGKLWGLKNNRTSGADVHAQAAWEITKGSKDVRIAVIDTGIDYNHPDLAANIWVNEAEKNGKAGVDDDGNGYIDDIHGYDFANNDGDPVDGHGHGTHCAGTIGAVHDNELGVAGVMSEVTLVPIKFLTDRGSGTTENAIKSIDYATKVGVDIMSNSWGGGGFSRGLKESIERASEAGIIFTAAAGNSGTNNDSRPHYPSNYEVPNVISVAAHTDQDQLAYFSCYGAKTVHVAAPGHKILSTVLNKGYKAYSGTSMATPHVSGALGLMLAHTGRISHEEMRERVLLTSVPVSTYKNKVIKGGRLSAYNLITDTRPERKEPNPEKWQVVALEEKMESAHPYLNSSEEERRFSFPGAKFIRVKIAKFELENKYDFLQVISGSDSSLAEKVSGAGENYTTAYVEGDSLVIKFSSDRSVNKWGYLIEEVEVQY